MTFPSPLVGEGDSAPAERGEGVRNLLANARTMRREPTEAERRLWALLRERRFSAHKFRRQILMRRREVEDRLFAALGDPSPRSPLASRPLPQGEREESDANG
ncbi:DUF559 domain-containing protein [Polymorphobacter multimanifer]|uniref:DUF559 domain-containing protein n=1 Tax=Polymorphobacter multimanifer TaxID=1070431 RepID=UPI0027E4AD4B|nr:DUF559 domain-containing protein [Polymorphobacter multimanifer]